MHVNDSSLKEHLAKIEHILNENEKEYNIIFLSVFIFHVSYLCIYNILYRRGVK